MIHSCQATTHVVFAGGGSGGHLFPGLATADALRHAMPEARITFAGTGAAFERQHVAALGFDYVAMPCRRSSSDLRRMPRFFLDNARGYFAARALLTTQRTRLVVGLGGFASAPIARAAVDLRVPLLLLEQNAVPGRVTRWLAAHADLVCTAFAESHAHLSRAPRIECLGNPIRSAFLTLDVAPFHPESKSPSRRVLLVLGGSQGARSLNEMAPQAVAQARVANGQWQIVHQSGVADVERVRQSYRQLGLRATVAPFFNRVDRLMARAALVVSRAGGTVLAELAAAGAPAILCPYPWAADDHQRRNAACVAASGAAVVCDGGDLGPLIEALIVDDARRRQMAAAAKRRARPQAACAVAARVAAILEARDTAHHALSQTTVAAAASPPPPARRLD